MPDKSNKTEDKLAFEAKEFASLEINSLFEKLDSNPKGLDKKEVLRRRQVFGLNEIVSQDPFWLWRKIGRQFTDLLVILLLIAGALSLAFQDYRDATVMFIIVLINAAIGFSQEYKTELILKKLTLLIPKKCHVLRDGGEQEISASALVPGDIIVLQAGDYIPADARLVRTFSFYTDESSLTGESIPKRKSLSSSKNKEVTQANMVYMGTMATQGSAQALVVATASNTEFGQIAESTHRIKEEFSPLQKKLREVGKTVSIVTVLIMVIFLIFGYFTGKKSLDTFLFALAVAAAVVPEGLPATVSVALSLSANRLARAKAVLRKLSSGESLGSVTVICSDKTGTITEGKSSVHTFWTLSDKELQPKNKINRESHHELVSNMFWCNTIKKIDKEIKGDPDEIAFWKVAEGFGFPPQTHQVGFHKVEEFSFSSKRRLMSVVFEKKEGKLFQHYQVYTKGAPDRVIEKANLTDRQKKDILTKVDNMASEGLRIFAFAHRTIPDKEFPFQEQSKIERELTFDGIVGLIDPIREEVPHAIKVCHQAGIRIMMITGDYSLTAQAVAEKINLSGEDEARYISGDKLSEMDDLELKESLQHSVVFYRTLPEEKLRIVENLQKMGESVAVTGDGVNDAPALKKADIGVAMGQIGTDIAREASDMVLLDDNFATIVKAIKEGRMIWENLKKIVFYVFASNAGELTTVVFGLVFLLPNPIRAVQILAVDLGTDVLPSLALAAEPVDPETMADKPRQSSETLLSKVVLSRLLYVGVIMGGGAVLVFWSLTRNGFNYAQATCGSYTTLVLCQVINAFSIRHPTKPVFADFLTNKYLLGAEVASFALLFSIQYLKPFQDFLGTNPLPTLGWVLILGITLLFWLVEELKKTYLRNIQK